MTRQPFHPVTWLALAALLAFAVAFPPPASGEAPPGFLLQWGSRGAGPGQFYNPDAVVVGPDGSVYVGDLGNGRIQQFTPDGVFLGQWRAGDPADTGLVFPRSLALDDSMHLYVLDQGNSRVYVHALDGTLLRSWGQYSDLGLPGTLFHPSSVAIGPDGHCRVVDVVHGIQEFTADGTFIREYDRSSVQDPGALFPAAVALDDAGNAYLADLQGERVVVFGPDGEPKFQWGSRGNGPGQFRDASRIRIGPDGSVYVTERPFFADPASIPPNERIQEFAPDGTLLAQWGSPGTGPGQFDWPEDIAFGPGGVMYVADVNNQRIQKFGPGTLAVRFAGLTAEPQRGSVLLRWSAFATGPAAFQVLRSPGAGGAFVPVSAEIPASGGTDFQWSDADVRAATQYEYKIGCREGSAWTYSGSLSVRTLDGVLALHVASANPARGAVRLVYQVPRAGAVALGIYDVTGRRICTLLKGRAEAGAATATWEGRDDAGQPVAPGIYFVRMAADQGTRVARLALLR